jgi:hypothetical protein
MCDSEGSRLLLTVYNCDDAPISINDHVELDPRWLRPLAFTDSKGVSHFLALFPSCSAFLTQIHHSSPLFFF